jgi:hypothetical protein
VEIVDADRRSPALEPASRLYRHGARTVDPATTSRNSGTQVMLKITPTMKAAGGRIKLNDSESSR